MDKNQKHEEICSDIAKSMDPEIARLRNGAKQLVPGDGNLRRPRLILVGEAPGKWEDIQGTPFVGKSGQFLDQLLTSIALAREDVWITNVVKYRPKGNETPDDDQIAAFRPYLRRELSLLSIGAEHHVIVALGRVAALTLLGPGPVQLSIMREHGTFRPLSRDWQLFISWHPANGIRFKQRRAEMIADFLNLGAYLDSCGE